MLAFQASYGDGALGTVVKLSQTLATAHVNCPTRPEPLYTSCRFSELGSEFQPVHSTCLAGEGTSDSIAIARQQEEGWGTIPYI